MPTQKYKTLRTSLSEIGFKPSQGKNLTAAQTEVLDKVAKLMRRVLISLISWIAIVACWILAMHIWNRSMSVGSEEKQALFFAFVVGCLVVLTCWPFCRILRRAPSALAGLVIGVAIPIMLGWIWGRLPEYSPGLSWSF